MYINQAPSWFFSSSDNLVFFCLSTFTLNTLSQTHIRLYKMLSFRSILFAAAAFATVVSAIPTPATLSGLTNALPVGGVGNALPIGAPAKRQDFAPFEGGADLAKRGHPSCGDIIKKCHEDIAVIYAKIGQCLFSFF